MDTTDTLSDIVKNLEQISFRKPKSKLVIYTGRPDSFSDNSKYLFLDACRNQYDFIPVWASSHPDVIELLVEAKLPVLPLATSLDACLRMLVKAAAVVFCVNTSEAIGDLRVRAALKGATKLQLWHGLFANRLDLQLTDNLCLQNTQTTHSLCGAADIDAVVSPSAHQDQHFYEAFGTTSIVRCGYPRNEVLFRPPHDDELLGAFNPSQLRDGLGAAKVLFCPTYSKRGDPVWQQSWLLELLKKLKAELGVVTYIKPHPFESHLAPSFNKLNDAAFLIPAKVDIYPALKHFEVMVSDYSSIIDDYHLTGKPVFMLRSPERKELEKSFLFKSLHYDRIARAVEPDDLTEAIRHSLEVATNLEAPATEYTVRHEDACMKLNLLLQNICQKKCPADAASRFQLLEL